MQRRSSALIFRVLCIYFALAVSCAGQQCEKLRVAGIKSIRGISPSPTANGDVLFYGSATPTGGELVTGSLFRLSMQGTRRDALRVKGSNATNPSTPVWQPDGASAYFATDQGIYRLNSADGRAQLLWKGPAAGLAISDDGFWLAFWHAETGADTLVLYDMKKNSETRTWRVVDRFEGDKTGWDLAFSHDGHIIYARTYGETSSTPLSRFDAISGNMQVVSPDCYALAKGNDALYFVEVSGSAISLRKISTPDASPTLVTGSFAYDSLWTGGSSRWIVAQDSRTTSVAVIDAETDSIKPIGKHDSAAVLSNGRLLTTHGSEIVIGDLSCGAKPATTFPPPTTKPTR